MDRSENVIYIYSFSQLSFRDFPWLLEVAPEKLIRSLSYLVSIRIMSLDWMTQKLLAKCITDGKYYENVQRIAGLNKGKRDPDVRISGSAGSSWRYLQKAQGGVYIWCRLPGNVDAKP